VGNSDADFLFPNLILGPLNCCGENVSIRSHLASTGRFLAHLYGQWDSLNIPKMSASLTYYTIVALAPLMVIFVAAAGFAFGSATARDHLVEAVRLQIGDAGASVIQALIERSSRPHLGAIATVAGAVALFFGATGVFIDLKGSLKAIWNVPETGPGGLRGVLIERAVSFGMVLVTGVVMVISISISIILSTIHHYAGTWMPARGGQAADMLLSFAVTTALFAMIYRVVPPEHMPWRDVAFGAAITAALFAVGKATIATYLGTVATASAYGAAGSLFAFLLWLYYSSQVFFIGAIITRSKTRVRRMGDAIRPDGERKEAGVPLQHAHPAGMHTRRGTFIRDID
jgi:membrane protein